MGQAIQGGVSHHRVWEQGNPILRGSVAGDQYQKDGQAAIGQGSGGRILRYWLIP